MYLHKVSVADAGLLLEYPASTSSGLSSNSLPKLFVRRETKAQVSGFEGAGLQPRRQRSLHTVALATEGTMLGPLIKLRFV